MYVQFLPFTFVLHILFFKIYTYKLFSTFLIKASAETDVIKLNVELLSEFLELN